MSSVESHEDILNPEYNGQIGDLTVESGMLFSLFKIININIYQIVLSENPERLAVSFRGTTRIKIGDISENIYVKGWIEGENIRIFNSTEERPHEVKFKIIIPEPIVVVKNKL